MRKDMKKKLIVGNLKMNPLSLAEMDRYLDSMEKELSGKKMEKTEIVVCPPAIFFDRVKSHKIKNLHLGAQNIFWEYQGAYTGEISAGMVKSLGAEYSLVGHSERRRYFGEEEKIISLKLRAILKNGLNAIVCIGESLEERKRNQTSEVLRKQLNNSLQEIAGTKTEYISIAYEPIWAVGTDRLPTSDEILEAKIIIKKTLCEIFPLKNVEKIRILYGGSVKSNLIQEACIDPAMDGVLVGRESLMPHEFVKMAEIIENS
jgi:triosephosphate isomerase (TIM)